MKAILDGLTVAWTHWPLMPAILLIVVVSQFLLYFTLRTIFRDKFTAEEYYSLSIAGWILPASLISLLWYFWGIILTPQAGVFIVIIIIVPFLFVTFVQIRNLKRDISRSTVLSLFLLTLIFVILRLTFVSKAVLPLYFDSAQHYLFTRDLLANLEKSNEAASLARSLTNYYHLGFHFLTAFISFITHAPITDTMLVLGQVILAIMPFSIFLIIRHETQSNSAGIFAVVLSAFGWYMPAHTVDWGKYPALASLALMPFVLSAAYLSIQNRSSLSSGKYSSLNTILLSGMLVSIFLHSRSLIVFGIAALTWIITSAWRKLSKPLRFFFLCVIIAVVIFEIIFIQTQGILGPLFDPYGPKGLIITSAVLVLSIFALKTYPRWAFSCIVSIFLFLGSLFIPLMDLIPGYTQVTLLDRPFVEMILYLPLTTLGGFGLAGLQHELRNGKMELGKVKFVAGGISVFFLALVVVNALFRYDLYPSDCCAIVSQDDLEAIEWMDKNLPIDARILTSSTELKVLPTDSFQGSAGGDAGTWINPLINRTSIPMPFNTDFSQRQTLDTLCQLQVGYVYVGGAGLAFNDSGMPVQPDGYKILLALPKAKLYEVTGCN
jgi:hypothetical protein